MVVKQRSLDWRPEPYPCTQGGVARRDGRGTAGGCCCPATSFCVSVALLPVSAGLPLGKFLLLRSWPFHRPIWASHVIMRSRASPPYPLTSSVSVSQGPAVLDAPSDYEIEYTFVR